MLRANNASSPGPEAESSAQPASVVFPYGDRILLAMTASNRRFEIKLSEARRAALPGRGIEN
jgi:hypothetical protein